MSTVGLLASFNRLLPFATPGTPVIQDLLHLAAICTLLYYAPQIQDLLQQRRNRPSASANSTGDHVPANDDQQAIHELDDRELQGEDEPLDQQQPQLDVPFEQEQNDEQHPQAGDVEIGQPGPAHLPNAATQRNVGAKKAKSLARRDQRRAYHEFMRSQGDAQRTRDAEGAAEREAAISAEQERRKAVAAELDTKKAREREERKARDEQDRKEELKRRELAVSMVKQQLAAHNMCDLFRVAKQIGGDVDDQWVERMLDAAGVLGRKGDVVTMVTSTGWVARVSASQMANLYITAAENSIGDEQSGKVEMDELGAVLETMLRA